jgi:hypothetical protein
MSLGEVKWRINQKAIQVKETKRKMGRSMLDPNMYGAETKVPTIPLRLLKYEEKTQYDKTIDEDILFTYINWHDGINTNKNWPEINAYKLGYKQKDTIGDARQNWELNRHLNLQILAKNYLVTKEERYLEALKTLFYDWVKSNPFLVGISYTSVMEVAIRAFSWFVVMDLLIEAGCIKEKFIGDLKVGIFNMATYVHRHYSRHSSANNHLIIEMVVLGIVGVSFGLDEWVELSKSTLTTEMKAQNHSDGVNKEQSIHYQGFVMEAAALYIYMLRQHQIEYEPSIDNILKRMGGFMARLIDVNGSVPDIGDDDEGVLLYLNGNKSNYYVYILQLLGILLEVDFVSYETINENIKFLYSQEIIEKKRKTYICKHSRCYQLGGYSILKHEDWKNERIFTFDHGPLGYLKIAAHGHADALSVTLSVNGEKILVDPGTYIYHIKLKWRNYFRSTLRHNTLTINNKDQSTMQGAFLWGKRAHVWLEKFSTSSDLDSVQAYHDGYKPLIHKRNIEYFKPNYMIITDQVTPTKGAKKFSYVLTYMINSHLEVTKIAPNKVRIMAKDNEIILRVDGEYRLLIEEEWLSKEYGTKEKTVALRVRGTCDAYLSINTYILIK